MKKNVLKNVIIFINMNMIINAINHVPKIPFIIMKIQDVLMKYLMVIIVMIPQG